MLLRAGEGLPSSLHLLSSHADPLTPEDSSLSLQVLSSFHGFRPISRDSASPFSSCETFLTTRQDSLHVTAWYVARPVSDRYFCRYAFTHRFRHTQVSKLRGDLAPPATGLSPARRCVPLGTPKKEKTAKAVRLLTKPRFFGAFAFITD